ncbi:MAG: glutamine amidotransferase [Candidatus Brocadiales bacterium]
MNFLAVNTGSHTQWSLTFAGVQSTWLFLIIVLVALLVLFFSWMGIKRVHSRPRRLLIFSLRVVATFLIVAALLQPQLLQREILRIKNKVALVFDSSQSMTLKGREADGKKVGETTQTYFSRFQMAKQFLKDNQSFIDRLERSFDVDYLAFSETVQELDKQSVDSLTPKGLRTDIANLLKDLKKRYTDTPIKGIFVFSDGNDTADFVRAEAVDEILKLAKELPAPVHTLCTGNPDVVKDLAINDVVSDDFAFVRNPLHVDVTIKVTGFNRLSFPVTLKQGENIIASKSLLTTSGENEYHVSMSFIPYTMGTFLYTITVPVQVGEVITDNNIANFQIHVIRDKIRVMHLCGRPSWDERFLREVLKKDPHIDLISFFILRTPSDMVDASNKELSLIPFPAEELFTRVLDSFDVVIFQNFDYRPYDLSLFRFPYYLTKVRDYVVETGGGFLMIGGDLSFSHGGYDGTSIEDILPVDLDGEKDRIDTKNFQPVLTNEGLRHPITMFDYNDDRNNKIWQNLPALMGCNVITRLKDDGVPLITHPSLKEGGEGLPVVAVKDVGNGRSMVVMTDSLWRWNFLAVGAGGSNRHYVKFWQTAIRWLIKDPELNLVRVSTNKEVFLPGENVDVRVKVLGRDYQPREGANVAVEIINESTTPPSILLVNGDSGGFDGKTDKEGMYNFSFKPERPGYHTVKASVVLDQKSGVRSTPTFRKEGTEGGWDSQLRTQDSSVFYVESLNNEFKDPSINEHLLMEISKLSGGKYFNLPTRDIHKELTIENPKVEKLIGKQNIPLWDNWLVYIAIVGTLAAEWWLRKTSGIS